MLLPYDNMRAIKLNICPKLALKLSCCWGVCLQYMTHNTTNIDVHFVVLSYILFIVLDSFKDKARDGPRLGRN